MTGGRGKREEGLRMQTAGVVPLVFDYARDVSGRIKIVMLLDQLRGSWG
jgi:hypothetical protein